MTSIVEEILGETGSEENEDPCTYELLIDGVRSNPVLFTMTHPDYRSIGKKDLVWDKISREIGQPVRWCKSKWKYLRDFYKTRKNLLRGKSGDAAKKLKKWPYFTQMSFLDDSIKDAETSGNVVEEASAAGDESLSQEMDETFKTPTKRRRSDVSDPVDEALIKYLSTQSSSQVNKPEKDPHYFFAMDLAESLRKLPPDAVAYVKFKVHQALFEVEQKLRHHTTSADLPKND